MNSNVIYNNGFFFSIYHAYNFGVTNMFNNIISNYHNAYFRVTNRINNIISNYHNTYFRVTNMIITNQSQQQTTSNYQIIQSKFHTTHILNLQSQSQLIIFNLNK